MNLLNGWHTLAPMAAVYTALSILNSKNNSPDNSGTIYDAGIYLFFALVFVAVSIFPPLHLPRNGKNFLIFFINYPFWFFSAIIPYYSANAINGAFSSGVILFLAMITQLVIYWVASNND